jgi:ethanolamine-phosphate cytidylyltransferase
MEMSQFVITKGKEKREINQRAKPIFSNVERDKLLQACKWVDRTLEDLPYYVSMETLDENNIDYILHGDDIIYNEQGESLYTKFEKVGRFK